MPYIPWRCMRYLEPGTNRGLKGVVSVQEPSLYVYFFCVVNKRGIRRCRSIRDIRIIQVYLATSISGA